jgi:hypothetical protein
MGNGSKPEVGSYMQHLHEMGGGQRMDTENGEDTMDFVNRIVNGGKEAPKKKNNERLAENLNDFNFNIPSIPAYEGIQNENNFRRPTPQRD